MSEQMQGVDWAALEAAHSAWEMSERKPPMPRNDWTPQEIKSIRERLGYTQEEFAEELGLQSYIAVSRWENGRAKPHRMLHVRLRQLEGLADSLERARG